MNYPHSTYATLKTLFDTVLDHLFPTKCVSCAVEGKALCDNCIQKIQRAEPPRDSFIFSIFDYRNQTMKQAIWALKFRGNRSLARIFAQAIHDRLLEETSDKMVFENFRHPLIVPIPLSKKRMKERGFNQSEAIARDLSFINTGGEWELGANVLLKIRDTAPQSSLKDKQKRARNIQGCFAITSNGTVCDRNIILIDDVTTTGATLREAKKVLQDGGARKIIAFTVAH
ncbi:MAG: hypothetical protein COZ49_03070 [Candidatus Yonathbacteria bacterium CG_4_10_14_3_um_filter_47_65]|uniref:Phosphoribosyltransferase domain-containing protein n=2 Tax=Parcubacteria group TaxID=1794811 RepID=A0A2M8D5X3_9BACT|nr:MAG: hypothetical protein AUJ44_02795 [Candidatus Nomurabacteria bacterium CG1_02_47_685]PIQ31235.1 MAG: hypothetical protein COW61_04190 [Candidatus Yonathbacteria bacterium CG17_big_fil_post_rev_8_21_14_2_50_46_19]PIX56261.1 MAG: hypothetical protein COZ49_03070 [Candidatus Yonathbacteria bacterium CG_4_10_14_3_um_filter_47_65]PIY57471.1 MAG: hypothetical protein COY99_03150 [Candidatus Yonathbacteria bacterium CG_4_10_14_0_8_um_filter_47_645]PJB82191.1 MAG: hypothetical protein CO088_0385